MLLAIYSLFAFFAIKTIAVPTPIITTTAMHIITIIVVASPPLSSLPVSLFELFVLSVVSLLSVVLLLLVVTLLSTVLLLSVVTLLSTVLLLSVVMLLSVVPPGFGVGSGSSITSKLLSHNQSSGSSQRYRPHPAVLYCGWCKIPLPWYVLHP